MGLDYSIQEKIILTQSDNSCYKESFRKKQARMVHCDTCAYCYRIHDNYIHLDNGDYNCSNSDVHITSEYNKSGSAVNSPRKEIDTDTLCIHINMGNNCRGYLKLEFKKVPKTFLGFVIGEQTLSNKVREDREHRMH
jgi:hypothetical protein